MIAADPDGAERRREAAERQADVRLYADDEQTATLHASKLPQIESAAGYARVSAMAKARMAAGFPGTLGFNRSQVLLGLMLDTMPPIPPAEGAPPDDCNPGHGADPGPGDGGPGRSGPGQDRPGGGPDDGAPMPPALTTVAAARTGQAMTPKAAGRGMTCPRRAMRTPRPTTALMNWPARDDQSWDAAEEDDDPSGTGPRRSGPRSA